MPVCEFVYILGVISDSAHVRSGYVLMRIKERPAETALRTRKYTLFRRPYARPVAWQAFATSFAFFVVGRPALQAFTERRYAVFSKRFPLNFSHRASVNFFIHLLWQLACFTFESSSGF